LRVNAPAVTYTRSLSPLGAAAAALGAFTGCTSSPTATLYTPLTGIQIPASAIVAGHGCGTRPDQVYKYAAAIAHATSDGGAPGMPFTSGVFDCFADAIFSNLPVETGIDPYQITIYAYNQCSFPEGLQCSPGATSCPGDDAGALQPFETSATWTSTCSATQFLGSTAIAACPTLEPSEAGSCKDAGLAE
jgi:hypothetical protein